MVPGLRRYIELLPGSQFWTPARVAGAAQFAAPVLGAAAGPIAASQLQPERLQHLPSPALQPGFVPKNETEAAAYGRQWHEARQREVRDDAVRQNQAEERRLAEESKLHDAEDRSKKTQEAIDAFRKTYGK